ncbi:MAG: SulA-like leucine-rich domain-containing protein [Thalassolituus sp.]
MRQLSFEVGPEIQPFSSSCGRVASPVRGSLTEVIVSEGSALQPFQLLPALALCNANKRWLMWLSPNQAMNKQWLVNAGLEKSPVLHMTTDSRTQFDLCNKIISAANSHLIVEWQGILTRETRTELRMIAEQNGTHLFLIRAD